MPVRHRIKDHRVVRAGDLVPHEDNFRLHSPKQAAVLEALFREIGFARSLLAYELPDGRLKLIDGHLRRELHPDEMVEVEVLDLNDEEARKLLLWLDPIAGMAYSDPTLRARPKVTFQESELAIPEPENDLQHIPEAYYVIVICKDEAEQTLLLGQLRAEGRNCKATLV
jgi:hypothetical protein